MKKNIRVALLDQQVLFRYSLENLLNSTPGIQVEQSTGNLGHLFKTLRPAEINLLILDIKDLFEEEWLMLAKLAHRFPEVRTLVLTDQIDKETFYRLLDVRIDACYSKNTKPEILLNALKNLCEQGRSINIQLCPEIRQMLIKLPPSRGKKNTVVTTFSKRELQVLQMVCLEHSNKEIAMKLNISTRTVETHRRRMIERTNSKTMLGVIVYAIEKGIYIVPYTSSSPD